MDALQKKAVEAEEAGDLPLALELRKERSTSDDNGISFLKIGRIAQKLERWEEAENAYTQALRLRPDFSFSKQLMGSLWLKRTDKDETASLQSAKEWFLSALQKKRNAPCLTMLGATYCALEDIPAAKRRSRKRLRSILTMTRRCITSLCLKKKPILKKLAICWIAQLKSIPTTRSPT